MKSPLAHSIAFLMLLAVAACRPQADSPTSPTTPPQTTTEEVFSEDTEAEIASEDTDSLSEAPSDEDGTEGDENSEPIAPNTTVTDSEPIVPAQALPTIDTFTLDELFANSGGGCGMTLWEPQNTDQDAFVLTHGLDADPMLMVLDGEWVQFSRIAASGEEFYGQATSQTFQSGDGNTIVLVNVEVGALGEIESVEIPTGTIVVERGGQAVELAVMGDAGC